MSNLIIVGGGNSVSEGIQKGLWSKIKNENVWALNYVYKFMPFEPTTILWYDYTFVKKMYKSLLETSSILVCAKSRQYTDTFFGDNKWNRFIMYNTTREVPLKNSLYVGSHRLTGTMALSLSIDYIAFDGTIFDEIYLLGYDFGIVNGKTHWYLEDALKTGINSNGFNNYGVYLEKKTDFSQNIPRDKIHDFDVFKNIKKITIVGKESNINVFKKIDYEEFFTILKKNKG